MLFESGAMLWIAMPICWYQVSGRKRQRKRERRDHVSKLYLVPGGSDGPSGVLVCTENFITYKHPEQEELRIPIPRRAQPLEDPKRGIIIVASAVHRMRVDKKTQFFFLLQSEEGDLYKVTMDHQEGVVNGLTIKYFDTIPIATSLCILKSGFLFVANEFGNQ